MAADETALGDLHSKVADVLARMLDGQALPTGERIEPSAAVITSAIQFLKNNSVTCVPEQGDAIEGLRAKIAQREERRKVRREITIDDLRFLEADAKFLLPPN
jgi:hypothetical protein